MVHTIGKNIQKAKEDFILNLKLLRASKDLSGKDLAEKTGMAIKRIADLEEGRVNPTLVDLVSISTFFNISYDDLLAKKSKSNFSIKQNDKSNERDKI